MKTLAGDYHVLDSVAVIAVISDAVVDFHTFHFRVYFLLVLKIC